MNWIIKQWNLFWLRRDTEQKRLLRDIGDLLIGHEKGKIWLYNSICKRLKDGKYFNPKEEKYL